MGDGPFPVGAITVTPDMVRIRPVCTTPLTPRRRAHRPHRPALAHGSGTDAGPGGRPGPPRRHGRRRPCRPEPPAARARTHQAPAAPGHAVQAMPGLARGAHLTPAPS